MVLVAELAAGAWAFQNSDKLDNVVRSAVKEAVQTQYGVIPMRTATLDAIQKHVSDFIFGHIFESPLHCLSLAYTHTLAIAHSKTQTGYKMMHFCLVFAFLATVQVLRGRGTKRLAIKRVQQCGAADTEHRDLQSTNHLQGAGNVLRVQHYARAVRKGDADGVPGVDQEAVASVRRCEYSGEGAGGSNAYTSQMHETKQSSDHIGGPVEIISPGNGLLYFVYFVSLF